MRALAATGKRHAHLLAQKELDCTMLIGCRIISRRMQRIFDDED